MAAIGEVIDDKYEILKLIGRGGMSRVYLAMDKRLNKQWAVKEIEKRARDKNNEVVIQSAIAEANMIKKLDHPALPRIVDIIDNGNVIYVIMDYIEGEALSKILETEGAQSEEAVIEWAKQLCEVLDYLHTRKPPIIYRDMKPANVMLKPDGTVKLIDFGIAREYKEHNLSDTINMGTKGYAAPEQFGNAGQTDARTDVYCLGVTLYHLITGHNPAEPPYEIYPIRHWDPQLSAGLEVIIQKCVQQNPDDRYQSCAELMYALQHYEEYGDEYRAAQRTKLKSFVITAVSSVVCLSLALVSLGISNSKSASDYQQNMTMAERASTNEDKISYYEKAIEIDPTRTEAYLEMIENFKYDDMSFSSEEEKVLLKYVSTIEKDDLKQPEDYQELCYQIGMLYWYFYRDTAISNTTDKTGRIRSVSWFSKVVDNENKTYENYERADIYKSIGEFDRDINTKSKQGTDQGEYIKYWENLEKLADDSKQSDNVELEICKLIIDTLEDKNNLYKFKDEGVTKERAQALYDKIVDRLNNVNLPEGSTDLKAMQDELLNSRIGATQNEINHVFDKSDNSADSDKNKGE